LEVLRTAIPLGQCIFKFVLGDGEFLRGEVGLDESYFGSIRKVKRGRGAKGKVKVEIVKDVSAETRLREAIKKVNRGYTDKFKAYDSLVGKL
jgi:transposase